ncbi:LysR family transcriptional regulator [Sessilibacter corallicola]|uniref:LysR family transcriptional regulator n=1 Tax=Sessilibacter corallicola TaxID=2904075 RepID=A0ABQ0A8M8_9GAMM
MNDISWRGIRAFIYVSEYRGFTAAAEASGFSKASLSQQVTNLEKTLGVQLLHRTTRQLRLTEVGEGYYRRCKQAFVMIDTASEWASRKTSELKGVIRVNSVGGVIGEELVAPLIMSFQQQHPGIEVNLEFSSIRVDLIEDHYDLVIRMGNMPDSGLVARTLRSVITRYVASPTFVEQHNKIIKPEDLAELPLIYGSINHWAMKRGKERRIIQVDRGMKVVSGRVMRRAALAGLGVTRLADVYCQSDIDKGRLVEILPDWSEQTPIAMVSPPVKHQLKRVRELMNWISGHFEENYLQLLCPGSSN